MSDETHDIIRVARDAPVSLPAARCEITVRPATMNDLPFIDSLQKKHTHMVGWMPTQQLEGKIKLGHVLVADEKGTAGYADDAEMTLNSSAQFAKSAVKPLGYCIGHDQYFKRDDVGIIYQLNVVPTKHRSLIGATLIKAMFDRAAYGCRLFCCWCAQDIEANYFWESLGFVPLAFRAGSRTKGAGGKPRVHIFWQRRIRAGDETTPYWFPAQTTSGAIREDRLVLPIPPGTHWRDAKPIVLPQESAEMNVLSAEKKGPRSKRARDSALGTQHLKAAITMGGLRFAVHEAPAREVKEKPTREKKKKVKNNPALVAAVRELRDRWLERVNADPSALLAQGKYDVSRMLDGPTSMVKMKPAARKHLPVAA